MRHVKHESTGRTSMLPMHASVAAPAWHTASNHTTWRCIAETVRTSWRSAAADVWIPMRNGGTNDVHCDTLSRCAGQATRELTVDGCHCH